MTFIRRIKKKSGTYLAEVEGYRDKQGKVRQRVIKYLGKEINGKPEKCIFASEVKVNRVKRSLDVLAVDAVAKELGITDLKNKYTLSLVYSQVLEKKSINRLEEWLRYTEIPDVLNIAQVSSKQLYESLGEIGEDELDQLNEKLYEIARKHDSSHDAAIVDVTDIYFSGKYEDIKRRKGKDGKIKKLIQIGLAVTFKHGFPLFHKKYHGNLSNIDIFRDMAFELESKRLKGIIVDRGMSSGDNIKIAKELKLKIICGLKKTQTITKKYLSTIIREDIYTLKNRVELKNTAVFIKSFPYSNGELIIAYNPALEVVKKELQFKKKEDVNDPYIGYSLIYHDTEYGPKDVVRQYYDKEIIERAFKKLKGILDLKTVRVWLENHVKGHINICYLAYAILAYMNYKLLGTKTSAVKALDSLKHGYRVTLATKTHEWDVHVQLEPKQKELLDALGVVYKK